MTEEGRGKTCQPTDERPRYEPPRALRVSDLGPGMGHCQDGSGDGAVCDTGNSAGDMCVDGNSPGPGYICENGTGVT